MIKEKREYYRILLGMSFPILMNYLVTTLFEVFDKAIVGNYSTEGFAAISIASSVIYTVTGSLGMLSVAYNIIAAERMGKNHIDKFREDFKLTMIISILVGFIVIIVSLLGGNFLFKYIFAIEDNILKKCLDYFYISSVTIMLNMIIFIFSAYYRNLKNTIITLYSTIVATVINIVFDYILVYGKFGFPECGVKGAAIGSVLGLLCGILVYIIKIYKDDTFELKICCDKETIKKLIKLYVPLLGQDLMECTVFTFMLTGIISRLNVYEIAAYGLSESMASIISLPIFAFSSAAMTLSLQKSFSGEENCARNILKSAITLSCIVVTTIGILIMTFPKLTFGVISNDIKVIQRVIEIFIIVILVQLINVFHQIYKSYLQGKNSEKFVLKCTIVVSIASTIWISFLSKKFGLFGIYIGITINYLLLTLLYSNKMKK